MPTAVVLRNNLKNAGMIDFEQRTDIADYLAEKELSVQDILEKVAEGLHAYACEDRQRPYARVLSYAPDITKVLLNGNASAINELAALNKLSSKL